MVCADNVSIAAIAAAGRFRTGEENLANTQRWSEV